MVQEHGTPQEEPISRPIPQITPEFESLQIPQITPESMQISPEPAQLTSEIQVQPQSEDSHHARAQGVVLIEQKRQDSPQTQDTSHNFNFEWLLWQTPSLSSWVRVIVYILVSVLLVWSIMQYGNPRGNNRNNGLYLGDPTFVQTSYTALVRTSSPLLVTTSPLAFHLFIFPSSLSSVNALGINRVFLRIFVR